MDIYFDEKTLNNIFNNNALTAELCECIGAVIDSELEKDDDEIDFAFIDECSNMLLDIQSGDFDSNSLLPILHSESFIESTKRLAKGGVVKFSRIALVAAIIMTTALTANAALGNITGKSIIDRIIEKTDAPATVQQEVSEVTTTQRTINQQYEYSDEDVDESTIEEDVSEKTEIVFEPETKKESVLYEEKEETKQSAATESGKHKIIDSAEEEQTSDTQPPTVTGIDAVVIHSVFKTEYAVGEEFSAEGLYIIANYSDGASKTVDISECDISGFDSSAPALCRVCLSYYDSTYLFDITVKEPETSTQADNDNENENN